MSRGKLTRPDVFRQSLLAGFEVCPRRTRFAIEAGDDSTTGWVGAAGALGTVFHAFAAEYFRTLYRMGEKQMATEEAVNVMREVYAAGDTVLPADERDALTGMVLGFCEHEWKPERILTLEKRLTLEMACRDGEIRTLKGTPDLVMSDPPYGLLVLDWKTGRGQPKEPREKTEGEVVTGKQYLSERGHYQLDTYGLLALKGKLDDGSLIAPGARYVTLREYHLRSRKIRQATLQLDELEHIEFEIPDHMQKVDRAIFEGPKSPLWAPRPGAHCAKQCPVARSCPVSREQRGDGAISTQLQADVAARQFVVAGGQAEQARVQLKAWQEAGNPAGRVNGREEVRWGPEVEAWRQKGGGRKFGLWPVVDSESTEEAA